MKLDGYVNMVNKVGTKKDPLEGYSYQAEMPTPDSELAQIYGSNGLFARIIDKPAELALKNGYKTGIGDADLEAMVEKRLAKLKWKSSAMKALKWSRLFGGAAILMGIDDGGDWDEPVNMDAVAGVTNLIVFERPEIYPEYESVFNRSLDYSNMERFAMPEYYLISPVYGGQIVRVHESRLLIFRNGELPRTSSMSTDYMFFGAPEYNRIKRELRDTVTTHGNGYRLLERCVQAVYKMKNLAALMATQDGEDDVIRRMQLIDMARSLLNTMVIDGDGEEYAFQTFQLSGVKDIVDESCNLLSAVTNIPQTVLFGRSPAGENATGEGDLTNYYDYVGQIQELSVTDNLRRIIELILTAYVNTGKIEEMPEIDLEPRPLWSLSEKEQAELDSSKAQAELTKAQATQIYVDMQVLDSKEVRRTLAESDAYQVDEILSEDDLENDLGLETLLQGYGDDLQNSEQENPQRDDGAKEEPYGAAVLVVKDGKILCGRRKDDGSICGPGGHIESGEKPEEAAVREAGEEFAIRPHGLVYLGETKGDGARYLPSHIFLCRQYEGEPECHNSEIENMCWASMEELSKEKLFPPFEASLNLLTGQLSLNRGKGEAGARGG